MIANVSAHRRANAFAQALEEQASGEPAENPVEPTERGRMLALTSRLGELPVPELDPEVKVVQRAQLVAAMEAMLQEGTARGSDSTGPRVPEQRKSGRGAHRASPFRKLRPRTRWQKGLAAGSITVGVAAGAFSGVAAASSDALPGDTLYGLKRGMEDIRLGMADGDSDRGELYLDHASTRLSEARRLMERGRAGDLDHESLGEVRRALNGMRHDVSEGHRLLHAAYERDGSLGPIQKLNTFSRSHRETWNGLRDRLPVQLQDVSNGVSEVFDAIEQEVQPLKSLLPELPAERRAPGGSTGSTSRQSGGAATPGERTIPASPKAPGTPSGKQTTKEPRPSGAPVPESGGLLPTEGLLAPPSPDTPTPPSAPQPDPASPDVSIPPLLDGILGIDITGEDQP
ncbi:DUF5667 domain-containing protein [Streptomyces clavuligerus]|uniref:DUF5667 domain-containing protein n=8 Tax=Streptomyces clavuligerus TaxID=1901 RepID=UPI0001851FD3|nr:DUF5667 domain-containing protein [Streptomyces clavuligerus]ANW19733.1 hypothetical protein BB341_16655 [Streptomyces clavuligerus]MBY6304350.1 hypothetical protein [Streptomyces clavuligerus]QPL64374.1 hypothetical protein I3J04_16880 [Streptomyces clavuligerus]QPL70402.1 hypothetical protein I3J05_16890 [Streptomyces clavuligerus]QPL76486.1 hypothetical protein I3J06_16895 [Streptomyces clavuligerus]